MEFLKRNLYPTGSEYDRWRRVAGCRRKLFCIPLVGLAGLFDGFVVQDEPSSCLVQEQLDQLTALLLIAHEDGDLDDSEEELLLLLTFGVEDAAASPCPHFSLP